MAKAEWSEAALLAAVRAEVLPRIEAAGTIEGWIVDDTVLPKKGRRSVGVTRQYCGQLGKRDTRGVAGVPAPRMVPGGGEPVGGG